MALRCLKCWKLLGSRSAMSWNAPHFYRHPISNATFKLLGCTKSQSSQVIPAKSSRCPGRRKFKARTFIHTHF